MWTTFNNLIVWFHAWEDFVLGQGFATKDGMEAMVVSLPTALPSRIVAGLEEAVPIHIMFINDAKEESNYAVNAAWILDLPHVTAQFRHDEEKTFAASVTTNEKGRTDGRVLKQVLNHYITQLFPDAADIPGKCVLLQIDGGPGRLDISNLAELISRGVYLFPGVQNMTHITQETDQNYGEFITLLRKYIQQLLNELYAKYHEQVQQQNNAPLAAPTLNQSLYGVLLGGRKANKDGAVATILPILQFSTCVFLRKKISPHGKLVVLYP
jgi:hypothetical protein